MTTTKNHHIVDEFKMEGLNIPFEVVLVKSVKEARDEKTGEVEKVIIPNFRGLLKCVAITRLCHPRKLIGDEIKFVRKAFKMPAKRLAEMIDVSPEHLSRCESGSKLLSPSAEKCLRVSVFLEQFKALDNLDKLCEDNEGLIESLSKVRKLVQKIGDVIGDMKIEPAFDTSPLQFTFTTVSESNPDLFEDDPNADWASNDADQALAA